MYQVDELTSTARDDASNNSTQNTTHSAAIVNNIGHVQQLEQVVSKDKGNKRQVSELDNTGDDDSVGHNIFLNDEQINLKKRNTTLHYLTPQQYTTSPNKPRLEEHDEAVLKKSFEIVLSEYHASSSSSLSMGIYYNNMDEQKHKKSLKNLPGTFGFLKTVLKQDLDDIPQYLWANGYDGCTADELTMNKMIRYILTDYHLNCMDDDNTANERTPFCEHFIPVFKAFARVTGLMKFTWCEKGLINNRLLSLCLPKPLLLRSLLDGVGISHKDKLERVLIESSGEDGGHTEEDTLKQISNTNHCLKMDLGRYKHSSYHTFLRRQIFGIHFIDDKMTLTSTRLIAPDRYAFVEVRSARIPTSYDQRWNWISVVELLVKLKDDLIEQEEVTSLLEQEHHSAVDVELSVNDALY
ncbi:unnamed protein product [Absidia cylindrospora]